MKRKNIWLCAPGFALAVSFGLWAPGASAWDVRRPVPILPEYARVSEVSFWNPDMSGRERFSTFEKTHLQGAFLASGDVDGDGEQELVVGAGPGRTADVRIYGLDGKVESSFRAYPLTFKGGVRVAVGDLDGDGKDEIVTAPGQGIEPIVHIFDATGTRKVVGGKPVYASGIQGGVHVAVGDLDGDGKDEIVTAPGPGGGPHIRIWNGALETLSEDFFAFDPGMRDGVSIAILKGKDGPMIAAAPESWATSTVRLFDGVSKSFLREFPVFDASSRNGTVLAAFDATGDGVDEIAASANGGTTPEVRILDLAGASMGKYLLHDPSYRGALSMVQVGSGASRRLATAAASPVVVGPLDTEKSIDVNITRQRLYAYEHGRVARTFLVSTGISKYPTPAVETTVLEKIPLKDYRWVYGKDHPDNYSLKNVKNNLRIYKSFYIHYAYWHRNFGHRMSHGCVNVGNADSEWIYNWADVGTPVKTHP